ncbi:MAG: uroporphyrinogen-III synthase [Parasphingorhabdus sp.]|uniref:uroporphyrinogen-III synthase n=1 Tax=Parasphingorhabdus sp. TaxID=2709688 RepID=UPI0032651825
MTLPLLILRPLDGALQTERRARGLDLSVVVDPLFVIEAVPWLAPKTAEFDALLLTSANALKFGGADLNIYQSLPVLAVGEKTAAAATDAGFQVVETGQAGAQDLLDHSTADQYRNILWLTGEQYTEISAPERHLHILPVYRSQACELGEQAKACLAEETAILLYSARAAQHLAAELDRLYLPKSRYHMLAFSAKVAEAAGNGWKSLHVADQPDDDALLSLASRLCL